MTQRGKGKPGGASGPPAGAGASARRTDPAGWPGGGAPTGWVIVLMGLLLALVTIALYWPATGHDFINYDDDFYVTSNVHVQNGLTLANLKWAFCNPVCYNWHPLTVLSHMVDCQLFGLKPWGHHLTSLLLHALNTALVFLVFRHLTGALWRSVFVAALFGWHPSHVESVAWVAERKDVLATFFFLLTLWAYGRCAEVQSLKSEAEGGAVPDPATRNTQHGIHCYLLSLFFFALGLMSKPMLVTVPFVLLLLNYWPLGRMQKVEASDTQHATRNTSHVSRLAAQSQIANRKSQMLLLLLVEKIPYFVLAAAASVVTFVVQQHGGLLASADTLPLGARGGNALVSYCRYLGKLFWPTDLAVFYPHPGYWPLANVLLAGGLLLGISWLLFVQQRRYPFMLMGWLWFCGTLAPVIQLVQTGVHAMADRYTYIPSLGVLILAVWGAWELTRRWRQSGVALSVTGGAAIVLCTVLTRHQLGHWKDSVSLLTHTLACTSETAVAHNYLGSALAEHEKLNEAIAHFERALQLKPDSVLACANLGKALTQQGKLDAAIAHFERALQLKPDYAEAHADLGVLLARQGKGNEAIAHCQRALQLAPDAAEAHYNLGLALIQLGKGNEAIPHFERALQLKANYAETHCNLGLALVQEGKWNAAIPQFERALQLKADYADAHNNLGVALARQGKWGAAIAHYERALELDPNSAEAGDNLAWLLATCSEGRFRNPAEALRRAERARELTQSRAPEVLDALAAAQAASGDYARAVASARQAVGLATARGNPVLAREIQNRLRLYETGQPYCEPDMDGGRKQP